jgi:pimeloyl-ACP methyl ester carboxylesterase
VSLQTENFFFTVQGKKLEVQRLTSNDRGKPTIVFLHEGLGSVSAWRDFPAKIVERTGCSAVVYSRYGYGNSEPLSEPRNSHYLHDEALHALPELLTKLSIENPILLGHSDGASIALIFAGANSAGANRVEAKGSGANGNRAGASRRVRGLIVIAPHVFVEHASVTGVAATKVAFETTDFAEKLAKHHRDTASAFLGWSNIVLNPDFHSWNIEEYVSRITCPVLAVQGVEDEYATLAHLDAISRLVPATVERLHLSNCGHSPHREQPEELLNAVAGFILTLPVARAAP